MPILQITAPHDSSKQIFNLPRHEIRIGRDQTADLQLDDPSVSRDHALVYPEQDAFFVADRQSMNGVWLNGGRLDKPAMLKNRDRIMVGDFELVFLK